MQALLKIGCALLPAVLLIAPVSAQEAVPGTPPGVEQGKTSEQEPAPVEQPWLPPGGNVLINLPTDQTLKKNYLQFFVTHRTHGSVRGSNARSLYSLSSQTVNFGFSYAPIAHSEVSISRSEDSDDYELAAKYAFRPGGENSRFGAALRIGGDDRRDPFVILEDGGIESDVKARTAFFAQTVLSLHLLSNRLEFSLIPSYVSRTVTETRVFNVPVHAAFAISRSVNLQVEYEPPRRRLRGSVAQWTVGIEKVLPGGRHRFTFVVSNTTITTTDLYLSADFLASIKRLQDRYPFISLRNNDPYLGFNLIRQFKLGR